MRISSWTAYGLLRELEGLGLVTRRSAPPAHSAAGGRSRIMFLPSAEPPSATPDALDKRLRTAFERFAPIVDEADAARAFLAEATSDMAYQLGFWLSRLEAAGRHAGVAGRAVLESGSLPLANLHGQSLLDGVDITPAEFYRRLPGAATHPTTSQPSPGRFAETYKALLENHESIVSIHISEKLSGTYASARQAADMTDPKRIRVVDSEVVSMSLGLVSIVAATLADRGAEPEAIEAKVVAMRPQLQTYFSVATLEFLRRGGRIGRANALLGSVLQVKPVLCIR